MSEDLIKTLEESGYTAEAQSIKNQLVAEQLNAIGRTDLAEALIGGSDPQNSQEDPALTPVQQEAAVIMQALKDNGMIDRD